MIQKLLEHLNIPTFSWIDAVEILIVAVIVYQVLLLLRRTRAVQMLTGLIILIVAYYLSGYLNFKTIHWILGRIFVYLPLAIIVIFQSTIRRFLVDFGRNPIKKLLGDTGSTFNLDQIVLAAVSLGSQKIGGLIVIERDVGLKNYIETGIALDSHVSYDLLVNIFNPDTPLHDGAVIIQDGRIAAASCILPLTSNPKLSPHYGSRHRAALGITEETDAVSIVFSEENGTISFAEDGELTRELDTVNLKRLLSEALFLQPPKSAKRKKKEEAGEVVAPSPEESPPLKKKKEAYGKDHKKADTRKKSST